MMPGNLHVAFKVHLFGDLETGRQFIIPVDLKLMTVDDIVVGRMSGDLVLASCVAPEALTSLRQQFLEGGVINEENGMFVFAQDYLLKSPSAAAAFVLGASANGWSEWKDEDGSTLSEVYREEEPDELAEN